MKQNTDTERLERVVGGEWMRDLSYPATYVTFIETYIAFDHKEVKELTDEQLRFEAMKRAHEAAVAVVDRVLNTMKLK